MVQIGIFGTNEVWDDRTVPVIIDEILNQCCEYFESDTVDAVATHSSGYGVGEDVFEIGQERGVKTVGLVLPSCKSIQTELPVDETVTVRDKWEAVKTEKRNDIMDVVVWVGDTNPEQDWAVLNSLQGVKMVTLSESMIDWVTPSNGRLRLSFPDDSEY